MGRRNPQADYDLKYALLWDTLDAVDLEQKYASKQASLSPRARRSLSRPARSQILSPAAANRRL
jgi:hypothetical protein